MIRFLLAFVAAFCWLPGIGLAQSPQPAAPPAQAAPIQSAPAQPALTKAQAENALEVLRDSAKRAQLIAVLEAIVRAAPPPPAPAAKPAAAAPAAGAAAPAPPAPGTAPATPAPEAKPLAIPLAPNSLVGQILDSASERLSRLPGDLVTDVEAFANFPPLGRFLLRLATDPDRQQLVLGTSWRLLVVLAAGMLAAAATRRALRGLTTAVEAAAPPGRVDVETPEDEEAGLAEAEAGQTEKLRRKPPALLLLRRLPFALGRFLLDLLPLLALLAVGNLIAGTALGDNYIARVVIIGVLQAIVACWLAVAVMRLLVSPGLPRLRLVPMSEQGAAYLVRWTRRLAGLIVFGTTAANLGLWFGLYHVAYDAALKLVSMAALVCLVIIVLQTRLPVARRVRAPEGKTGAVAVLRNRVAAAWHGVTILCLVGLWLVWALAVPNGFALLARVGLSTIAVALLARLLAIAAYGMLDHAMRISPETAFRHPGLEARLRHYHPVARALLTAIIAVAACIALFQAWGLDPVAWFTASALGGQIIGALGSIGTTLVLSLAVWEAANGGMQMHLARLARDGQAARSARIRTLLPMLRTTLLVSIGTFAGLIVLSEIGLNIAPLLAGAGVVGLAVGFGSQKLVQDIITGLFLLMENTMQVGDVVSLGGLSGTVEALSIRTIRLRALDGSVHVVPFSAVTTVTNQTRDFGYAVVDVSVGLNEDPDHVAAVLREAAGEMRADPRWESIVRDDLEVLGVDSFLESALVLKTRTKTVPSQRWAVARELNRRIKMRFDELAIESPWTSHRVLSTVPAPAPTTE